MKEIRTIEEYLIAKEKGLSSTFGPNTPPEVIKFIVDDVDKHNKNIIAKENKLIDENNNKVYELSSTFIFGKHKGNELRYTYKCDPCYVEWCMLNASGFIISDRALLLMQNENVFDTNQLSKYFEIENSDELKINLESFRFNQNGFPFSSNVGEIKFIFSDQAIFENNKKSHTKMTALDLAKGGNWGVLNNQSSHRLKKKSIRIKQIKEK